MGTDVSKEEIMRLAHLARLEFTEEEASRMQGDMGKILEFVDKINRLDLEGVQPMVYMTEGEDLLREDEDHYNITKDEALKNAPDRDTDYFKVPKVLKRDQS